MTMRIERSKAFKRDFKRELKTYGSGLSEILDDVLAMLIMDGKLPDRYHNHKLSGVWDSLSECHLKPDLLLIYEIIPESADDGCLYLSRLGSHSKIFG